jgi:hypothetical protein
VPEAEPTGIRPDRAVVDRIEDGRAALLVGPGRTPIYLDVEELPRGAGVGTWLVLDLQSTPPLALSIDTGLTGEGPKGTG